MKDPETSAIHGDPLLDEESTGTYRHPLHQYALEQWREAPSEQKLRSSHLVPQPSQPSNVVAARHHRVLLAVASDSVTFVLTPIIRALAAAVVKVDNGIDLEDALRERGDFDLVLCDSRLPSGTGLAVLTGMRRSSHRTPFVIVQSIYEQLVRVVVGGGAGTVLSTHLVNELALIELAEGLLGLHEASASSCRAPCLAAGVTG